MNNIITTYKTKSDVETLLLSAKANHTNIIIGVIPKSGIFADILTPDSVIEVHPNLITKDLTANINCDCKYLYNILPNNKKFLGDNPEHVSAALINDTFNFVIFNRQDLINYVSSMNKEVDLLLDKIKKAKDVMYYIK